MRLRRGHAIFIHEIWLNCVFQPSSPAPVPMLAHGCQLNPRDGVNCARALGRSAQRRCPLAGVFCEPYSPFGTAIQSSPKIFALRNTPSPIPSRSGRILGMFSGGGGDPPSQVFHQTWEISLDFLSLNEVCSNKQQI